MTTPLTEVLHDSRALGFLGPGPIDAQIEHAGAFLAALVDHSRILDLGSGGGLPGLVLACALPGATFVLLDGNSRRCQFLAAAVERLALTDRVSVELGRAEELARRDDLRGAFDAVVSRSFGSPAVTAECAAGFLRGPGSTLVVSEPPSGSDERWPIDGLAPLGMEPGPRHDLAYGTIQEIVVVERCPERFPRRVGIPAKRPLFHVEQVQGA